MTAAQPPPPSETHQTYWQASSTSSTDSQILPRLRMRLVGLVAAMVVQATIALLGVLPDVPGVRDLRGGSDSYYIASQTVSFWFQFAAIEFIAALVVSFSFGPGVRVSDVPVIGRLLLGLGFVAVPAVAIVLGVIEAAQISAAKSPVETASTWLTTAFFGTLFFGLPLIAMIAHASRARLERAGQRPA